MSMIDIWLWMFEAMLIARCMFSVCVCKLDASIKYAFNRVKT